MRYFSLPHETLLPSPVISTTGCVVDVNLGSSSFSVLYFCVFIQFMGFSRQEYWSGLPFPSPVDHVLSELSTMTHPSYVTLHGIRSDRISCSVMSDSLRLHELQHARPPCPSPTPGVHWDSNPLSQWCHPAISSSVVPFFSCPQSLPASESFPMSQLFTWGGHSTGVSALASFLSKKSQGWSPSEWLIVYWVRQGCRPYDQFDLFSVIVVFILSSLWWIR